MWTLLIILGYLITDSTLTDPCVNHTVLDQPWRSIDCDVTVGSGQEKCDDNLAQGWYRFKSSGGWKIPDTVVPDFHCSTRATGWLQGSHPSVGNGEVTRTVCFNKAGNRCHWTQEIKIINCSSYFVYELKPPPDCEAVYCTVTDSALTDPCVNHTVLDQPWRSSDCDVTGCSGQEKCDDNLAQGWYRFKSSGGWKIPETAVPDFHCSTHVTGWLNGSHPSVGQGEVTRTVCLSWGRKHCDKVHEIKIKNCSSYFVYELKSLFYCAAYCTDPETVATEEPEEQTTRESTRGSSSTPAVSGTSDTKYKRINVKITSMTDLDDETAKRIVVERMKHMFQDQCPHTKLELDPEDVQCSASEPVEV
ncbi:uncharacterized protein [Heterodontus francisci]|uniref:uncharacterized protein n=1 Tax=Heterodontus francisci TaxID=7792 RepID=UPI00355BEE3A